MSGPDEDLWAISLDKVTSIVSILENSYYKDLDSEKLAYASIRGLLETLDPHSYFLEPENFSRMREDYVGKYYGLGIQIQKQEDRLVVIAPIEGTPAWRLGVQPGDIISTSTARARSRSRASTPCRSSAAKRGQRSTSPSSGRASTNPST